MAVIEECEKGFDGLIRSVRLKLPDGRVIARPVNKVYPLEIQVEEESQENQRQAESNQSSETGTHKRPIIQREAARVARMKIQKQLQDEVEAVFFSAGSVAAEAMV